MPLALSARQHLQACRRDACSLIMQTGSSSATLASLDREVLTAIFSLLDPVSLATVSCTNRELRSLSSSAVLWTTLCKSRWQNLNTPCVVCHTQTTKLSEEESKQRTTPVAATNNSSSLADPHALYAINNCWGGCTSPKSKATAFVSVRILLLTSVSVQLQLLMCGQIVMPAETSFILWAAP